MEERDSGRVDRVMVACVSREVVMVTEPAIHYGVDRMHILNYVSCKDATQADRDRAQVYRDVLEAVRGRLDEAGIEMVVHDRAPTYRFDYMLREVFSILHSESLRGSCVFVNISGGTSEYAAAAAVASMMFGNVRPFNVGSRNSDESARQLREMLTEDGRIIGTARDVHPPFPIERIPLSSPDGRLLRSLKVFATIPLRKRTNTNVIYNLAGIGLWNGVGRDAPEADRFEGTSFAMESSRGHPSGDREVYRKLQNKERVRYQNDFINKWKETGWIEHPGDHDRKKYELTAAGRMYVEVFCSDEVFPYREEDVVFLS